MYREKVDQHTIKAKPIKAIDLVILHCFFVLEFVVDIIPVIAIFHTL